MEDQLSWKSLSDDEYSYFDPSPSDAFRSDPFSKPGEFMMPGIDPFSMSYGKKEDNDNFSNGHDNEDTISESHVEMSSYIDGFSMRKNEDDIPEKENAPFGFSSHQLKQDAHFISPKLSSLSSSSFNVIPSSVQEKEMNCHSTFVFDFPWTNETNVQALETKISYLQNKIIKVESNVVTKEQINKEREMHSIMENKKKDQEVICKSSICMTFKKFNMHTNIFIS